MFHKRSFWIFRLSLLSLAARRLWSQRLLMLCLLLGLVAAVGLLSSIPLYADAAQNRLLQGELETGDAASDAETATARPPFSFLWRYIGAWHGNVAWDKYGPVDVYLTEQAPAIVDLPLETLVRHVATDKMRLFPSEDAAFVPDEPLAYLFHKQLRGFHQLQALQSQDNKRSDLGLFHLGH